MGRKVCEDVMARRRKDGANHQAGSLGSADHYDLGDGGQFLAARNPPPAHLTLPSPSTPLLTTTSPTPLTFDMVYYGEDDEPDQAQFRKK